MDEERIALAKAGDREAQEELVRAYYGYVMGYLIKLTLSRELAEDLTQEAFLRALRALPTWRGDSKIGSWLIAIAHNLYRDHIRLSGRRKTVPLQDAPLSDSGSGAQSMELSLEAKEALENLRALSADRREIVVLKYYYGYTSKEIAKILRIPEGTVRSRLHYALQPNARRKEG
jgi:RNA polymerase sigma-70 factor (ECF subfamily)